MKSMYLFFVFFVRFYYVDAWINSYAVIIYPVKNEDDWVVADDTKLIKVLKPAYLPKVSCPKANYRPSPGEKNKALRHCSSYGGQGHNRSTCKYIMSTPSNVCGSGSRATQ